MPISSPLDLIAAHPWRRAVFTTYALSLSFFEAVVLDALMRGGAREALIMADVDGVRASLSEQGARRAGRDYEVEPIAVRRGVFHPKLSVMIADDECHLLVGSGNLTFNGWGGNLELLEHLSPAFAADAIDDAASFFEQLALADDINHGVVDQCADVAGELRASSRGKPRNGDIRLLHSLDGPISDKIAAAAEELGGATKLIVVAPFWDEGRAIDRLCQALQLDHVFIHAHDGGTVEGRLGANWPSQPGAKVSAVALEMLREDKPRRLHAKAFEIMCKRGRLLVSGSANATMAALQGHNVEMCVMRLQREGAIGWDFQASSPPDLIATPTDNADDEGAEVGIIRAVLDGDRISGRVLTPTVTGLASIAQVTTEGPRLLGETELAADGSFSIPAPGLELESWKGGRLMLRVTDSLGRRAEGFVSFAAFAEMTHRAGALGPRLLAILAGTEAPEDVAAIMSWFYEDPSRMVQASIPGTSGSNLGLDAADQRSVAVADLRTVRPSIGHLSRTPIGETGWVRFMDHIFAALREQRGPMEQVASLGDRVAEDVEGDEAYEARTAGRAVEQSLSIFDKLFDRMVSPEMAHMHAVRALDLTLYICERLRPEQDRVRGWLRRLVDVLTQIDLPADRHEQVAAGILTLAGTHVDRNELRSARSRLLSIGFDIDHDCPSPELAQGFLSVLDQTMPFSELCSEVSRIRTFQEQARAYLDALASGHPTEDRYVELAQAAPEEFEVLGKAFTSERARNRIVVLKQWAEACPRCYRALPKIEIAKLRSTSLATARNCCDRILVWPGKG